jgi:hypothetical protein
MSEDRAISGHSCGRFVATLVLAVAAGACNEKKPSPNATAQPSPNASLLPAPLASAPEPPGAVTHQPMIGIPADSAGRLIVREPEPPPPEPVPSDRALPNDNLTVKDSAGYTIEGAFHWADLPPPLSVPELSAAAVREAAAQTELNVTVDLASTGRMRLAFDSATFPLPANAELRAHSAYYGHVLVWPDGSAYRVLPPGSLRAMFAERRADVSPLLRAKVTPGDNGTLLDHKTQRTTLETSLGTLVLEQAIVPGSAGGALLCRFLVELVGADPSTEACRAERVPLSAHYRWAPSGSFSFVATSIVERKELPIGYVYVPPAGATFSQGQLPPSTSGVFLNRDTLTKFRTHGVRVAPPSARAPGEGITAVNHTTTLQYVLLDGVPIAWVRPRSQQYVIGPPSGRYSVAWRDFFGTALTAPTPTELPALVQLGLEDGDGGTGR